MILHGKTEVKMQVKISSRDGYDVGMFKGKYDNWRTFITRSLEEFHEFMDALQERAINLPSTWIFTNARTRAEKHWAMDYANRPGLIDLGDNYDGGAKWAEIFLEVPPHKLVRPKTQWFIDFMLVGTSGNAYDSHEAMGTARGFIPTPGEIASYHEKWKKAVLERKRKEQR